MRAMYFCENIHAGMKKEENISFNTISHILKLNVKEKHEF